MPRPHGERKYNSKIAGYLEHADDGIVRGWAFDAGRPKLHLKLDVFVRGVFAGCARTGRFRPDLARNGIGDGTHAFVFHLPPACATADITLDDVEAYTIETNPVRLGRVRSEQLVPPAPADKMRPATVFGPLIASLMADRGSPDLTIPGRRRQMEKMLAAASDARASAFAAHIAAKYAKPIGGDSFWAWYLEHYLVEKGETRPPLSSIDLTAVSALRDMRGFRPSPSRRLKARYDWAVDAARRVYLEDCLIEPKVRALLLRSPFYGRWQQFPLSLFMSLFRARHALLKSYSIYNKDDRIRIYAIVMLYALRDPHYLAYVPAFWLQAMLAGGDGASLFEQAQTTIVTPRHVIDPTSYREHLGRLGFDLETQQFDATNDRRQRVRGGDRMLGGDAQVDIQVFGPFTRKLGLSESALRLARAINRLGYTSNMVDVDIGPFSQRALSSLELSNPKRAKINILHLNAEEIPETIASLPDCFAESHTIAFPYWELSHPARVHRLGLSIVDEIWTSTEFLAAVFRQPDKAAKSVGLSCDDRIDVPHEEGRKAIAALGVPTDGFIFLATSDALSWAQRKNVMGAIDAFSSAFPAAKASLIIKARNLDGPLDPSQRTHWDTIRARCAADPRITLLEADVSADAQRALLAGCDCLLSLHRAEGLGLDLLDALGRGTPVVATAYSGNVDFCRPDTAWLVDFDLVPVRAEDYCFVEPRHVWAEPRLDSAVSAMRGVVADPAERMRRMQAGKAFVRDQWSEEAFAGRLDQALRPLLR